MASEGYRCKVTQTASYAQLQAANHLPFIQLYWGLCLVNFWWPTGGMVYAWKGTWTFVQQLHANWQPFFVGNETLNKMSNLFLHWPIPALWEKATMPGALQCRKEVTEGDMIEAHKIMCGSSSSHWHSNRMRCSTNKTSSKLSSLCNKFVELLAI